MRSILLLMAISMPVFAETPIHSVRSQAELAGALERVPQTQLMPPDFADRMKAHVFLLEMSTSPNCLPCADMWRNLTQFRKLYGWPVRTIGRSDALMRMGELELPWIGDPVVFVRPVVDEHRVLPVALGDDHLINLERNIYLDVGMLMGLRPAIAVRMMSRFTGIVAPEP